MQENGKIVALYTQLGFDDLHTALQHLNEQCDQGKHRRKYHKKKAVESLLVRAKANG
jgi:hypothetical protein